MNVALYKKKNTAYSRSCDLCDRALLGLIQEQSLEHVVVEVGVVEAGPGTVGAEVKLQDLRLHDALAWPMIRTHTG